MPADFDADHGAFTYAPRLTFACYEKGTTKIPINPSEPATKMTKNRHLDDVVQALVDTICRVKDDKTLQSMAQRALDPSYAIFELSKSNNQALAVAAHYASTGSDFGFADVMNFSHVHLGQALPSSTVHRSIAELVRAGFIEDKGRGKRGETARNGQFYAITDAGLAKFIQANLSALERECEPNCE